MNIKNAIKSASEHYRAGNLRQAEIDLARVLESEPDNHIALSMLGIICYQLKEYDSAIGYLKKLIDSGRQDAQAFYIIGHSLQELGKSGEAVPYYQKAIETDSGFHNAYYNLGTIFQDNKRTGEAISCYRKALEINPADIDACYNTALLLQDDGQLDEALIHYQKALQMNPNIPDVYNNLGIILQKKGLYDEAVACYQEALQINPHLPDAYNNLGIVHQHKMQYGEAAGCYQQALRIKPDFAAAYYGLGIIFRYRGQIEEAQSYLRRAIEIDPENPFFHESLLFLMLFDPHFDGKSILAEHLRFAEKFLKPLSSLIPRHNRRRCSGKRLKIGYVSPDFRRHSVSYFIEPVIKAHNRECVDVFCYSNNFIEDEVTERIRSQCDQWRNIAGISEEKAAQTISEDGIDILVDLAGHTADNRMLLFARKPAPVQVSWIGYPATTGLSEIDYKIVDKYTDPPGLTEEFYAEKLMRLPGCFLCYLPDGDSPEIGGLPVQKAGHVTFGSFNTFAKISPGAFALWTDILKAVPDSRLLLKSNVLSDETVRNRVIDIFYKNGIDAERIELLHWMSSTREHLEIYNRVDIGLDTFPYNGTTTTCEAMWMGVPVVALEGDTHAARVGVSLLSNAGLQELVARSYDEYASIAVNLSGNPDKLRSMRRRLRDTMSQSPMGNAKGLVRSLEDCYRRMWEIWCKS